MSVEEEIAAMMEVIDKPTVEEHKIEEPPVEPKPEDKPAEQPPVEPEKKEEVPPEEQKEEPKPEDKEPEPPKEPDPRDVELTNLRAEVEALKTKPKEEPKPEEPPKEEIFITDSMDLDELSRDPKELNKVFNSVYAKGKKDTMEEVMKQLPSIIYAQVEIVNAAKAATDQFYKDNSDLSDNKPVVQSIYKELITANPSISSDDLMKRTAAEARKRLRLPDPSKAKGTPPPPPPSGRTGRAGTPPADNKPSGIVSELEEMDKALNS